MALMRSSTGIVDEPALDVDAEAGDRRFPPIAPKPVERDDDRVGAGIEVAKLADDRELLLAGRRWNAERLSDVERPREREPLRHDDAGAVRNRRERGEGSAPRMSRPQPSGPGRMARTANSPAGVGTSTERVRLTPRTLSDAARASTSCSSVRDSAVAVERYVQVGAECRAEPVVETRAEARDHQPNAVHGRDRDRECGRRDAGAAQRSTDAAHRQ